MVLVVISGVSITIRLFIQQLRICRECFGYPRGGEGINMGLQCGGGDFTDLGVFHPKEEEKRLDTIGTNDTPNELY